MPEPHQSPVPHQATSDNPGPIPSPDSSNLVSSRPDFTAPTCPGSHDTLIRAFSEGEVRSLRPASAEPLYYYVTFASGLQATFAPARPNEPDLPRLHAANYRVARFLDMGNAVPTVTREFTTSDFEKLDEDYRDTWTELQREMRWDNGRVLGSLSCLSAGVRDLGLGRRQSATEWSERLGRNGEIPADEQSLYSDLSDLVILDYVVGNTRRIGSPVFGTADASRLLFGAPTRSFPDFLPAVEARKHRRHLRRSTKFSIHTLRRLSLLNPDTLTRELDFDPNSPLLTEPQIWGAVDRAETALSYAVSVRDSLGDGESLPFP